ncbi:hypothetical protein C8N32_104175 [Rhodovulum imhoffii]|uniref:PH (Pleckstrin Homology) domain-containing protein n=1 Tax=Rhodovulum imhoffii TaxID=365340 RepID=A0A2T5BUB2_9RHOB|nr:hypothetical protein [Rhodovulum imhoffii]MBK5934519.1 hypothetical protein [Rhodovulum imhoffii]PTN03064.1 hypothetical protein C8N32_104175 [Rhodovulum imhoffii]
MHDPAYRVPLADGEHVIESFHTDRAAYIRDHVLMAAIGGVGAMAGMYLMGNPDFWVGAVAALAAVAVRGGYLASEDLSARWDLTGTRLIGPQGRAARLAEIEKLNNLGSAIQIVTRSGDKHLMKYLADKPAVKARLEAAIRTAR